ncbi:hypothetical protein ABK040_013445 [Willaertia magna]
MSSLTNGYSFQIFSSQNILDISKELGYPQCITNNNQDYLHENKEINKEINQLKEDKDDKLKEEEEPLFWVAYSSGIVKGYSSILYGNFNDKINNKYEFKSVDKEILEMKYLFKKQCIITIERRRRNNNLNNNQNINNVNDQNYIIYNNCNDKNECIFKESETIDFCRVYFLQNIFLQKHDNCTILNNNNINNINNNNNIHVNNLMTKISTNNNNSLNSLTSFANNDSTLLLSVCNLNNYILLCNRDDLTLWQFKEDYNLQENNLQNEINNLQQEENNIYFECILKINTNWNIKYINLFDNFIGYASDKDVRILQFIKREKFKNIIKQNTNKTKEINILNNDNRLLWLPNNFTKEDVNKSFSSTSSLSTINDLNTSITHNSITNFNNNNSVNRSSNRSRSNSLINYWGVSHLQSSIVSTLQKDNLEENLLQQKDQENLNNSLLINKEIQIRFDKNTKRLLPSPSLQKINYDLNKLNKNSNTQYNIIKETFINDHPIFINNNFINNCYQLLYKHYNNDEIPNGIHFLQNNLKDNNLLHNNSSSSTFGIKFIITTGKGVTIYQLLNNNNQIQQNVTCQFNFSDNCLQSLINTSLNFLYIITPVGLEIWTLNGFLLRIHPFIGLKNIIVTKEYVFLLSKFSDCEKITIAAYYPKGSSSNSGSGNSSGSKNKVKNSSKDNGSTTTTANTTTTTVYISDISSINKNSQMNNSGNAGGSLLPIFNTLSNYRNKNKRNSLISNTNLREELLMEKEEEEVKYSYNIYILKCVELKEIYEEMMEYVEQIGCTNQTSIINNLKLMKEINILLQFKYFNLLKLNNNASIDSKDSTNLEMNNYLQLLQKSFGLIGDYFIKLKSYDQAAYAYSNSDKSITYIFEQLNYQSSPPMLQINKKNDYNNNKNNENINISSFTTNNNDSPILLFLEFILFDKDKKYFFNEINETLSNDILSLYKKYIPQELSSILIESNLKNYSKLYAINLLEEIGLESVKTNQQQLALYNGHSDDVHHNNNIEEEEEHVERVDSNLYELHTNDGISLMENNILPIINISKVNDIHSEALVPSIIVTDKEKGEELGKEQQQEEEDDDDYIVECWCELLPKDAMVISLLYLETNQLDLAVKVLSSLEPNCIIDFCLTNVKFLINENYDNSIIEFSDFTKLLKDYFPWILLEILIRLYLQFNNSTTIDNDHNICGNIKDTNEERGNQLKIIKLLTNTTKVLQLLENNNQQQQFKEGDNMKEQLNVKLYQQTYLSTVFLTFNNESDDNSNNNCKLKELGELLLNNYVDQLLILQNCLKNNLQNNFEIFNDLNTFTELKTNFSFLQNHFIYFYKNSFEWLQSLNNYLLNNNYLNFINLSNENDIIDKLKEMNEKLNTDILYYYINEDNLLIYLFFIFYNIQGLLIYFNINKKENNNFDSILTRISKQLINKDNNNNNYWLNIILILIYIGSNNLQLAMKEFIYLLEIIKKEDHNNNNSEFNNNKINNNEIVGTNNQINFKESLIVNKENEEMKRNELIELFFLFCNEHCKEINHWKDLINILIEHLNLNKQQKVQQQTQQEEKVDKEDKLKDSFIYFLLEKLLDYLSFEISFEEFNNLLLESNNNNMDTKYLFNNFIQNCFAYQALK